MHVFIIFQLFANELWVRTNGKTTTLQETQGDLTFLMLLTLLSADAKSTLLLRVPLLTKVQVRNF